MITMDARAEQRQNQTLSPRLQHAVRLLQMSSLDFGITVRDVLGRNPFLEMEEGAEDADEDIRASDPTDSAAGTEDEGARAGDLDLESDRALWLSDGTPPRQPREGDSSAPDMPGVPRATPTHRPPSWSSTRPRCYPRDRRRAWAPAATLRSPRTRR